MPDPVHVLHVDDDPAFADMTTTFLEREDDRISVQTATSADDGLQIVRRRDIDCVVSDYDLPGQSGIGFLRAVREECPDLPFILYTGKGSEEVAMDAISAGVTEYLQKGGGADQYTVLANRITNVVESYRSEQKLAERNKDLRRYKDMVNSMQDAACIYDEDGRFVVVNEHLADWYDTTREDLTGQKSTLLPLVRERATDTDPYRALLDGERDQYSTEIEVEFPTHGDAVLEYQLTPLLVDGTVEGIVGVSREITKLKEREQELREERDRLDEFAGVVSHDLQNPLSVARGRVELAQAECDSEHLDTISTALDRISRITEDVLWLAREGRDIGSVADVPLAGTVDDAWDIVADRDEHTALRYADEAAPTATVEADSDRLRQLIENLLSNAIEHGGEDVTVTVGTVDDGFYIEDDGPGIPEDRRTDVFTAGYSTADEGTGFGLSIVKRITEAHGWNIQVTEGAAGGARFEITGVEFGSK
ncbi:hybrid sensor histidine kinase/response regulator [Haloarcula sediminis]|uniref:hybrid sensor histidine kinase/response regulator n=1 Tax=Haloarcula sediminis TaxID=3111777 RepID=UPI002D770EC4|nr:ATP-binding protein [Haloarcula sp. CK38]